MGDHAPVEPRGGREGRPRRRVADALPAGSRSPGRGRAPAAPRRWSGASARGSGKTPYQVSIDLAGPAYRCSCPSRKFPCKHALALLLLWVRGRRLGRRRRAPGRLRRGVGRAARRAPSDRPAHSTGRSRRRGPAGRPSGWPLMTAGIDGLRAVAGRPGPRRHGAGRATPALRLVGRRRRAPGRRPAARPGRAGPHHGLGGQPARGLGRPPARASSAGGGRRCRPGAGGTSSTSGPGRTCGPTSGGPSATDDVRAGETVTDAWLVLGAHRSDDGRLQQQRTWLQRRRRAASTVQLLDFAAGGAPLPMAHLAGSVLDATLAIYPGSHPRRALARRRLRRCVPRRPRRARDGSLRDALGDLAAAWAVNPWSARVPVVLASQHSCR